MTCDELSAKTRTSFYDVFRRGQTMPEYKYTLTRYCLRNGQLTLPQSMLELFPSEGSFKAVDTRQNEEFTLHVAAPRTIGGVEGFFKLHGLVVNDAILIRLQDDGHYAFTPLARVRKVNDRPALDALAEQRVALSEAEMQTLYPDLEHHVLADSLAQDERFTLKKGRWHIVDAQPESTSTADVSGQDAAEREVETPLSTDAAPNSGLPQLPAARPSFESSFARFRENVAKSSKAKRASVTPYPRVVIFPGDSGLNSEQEPSDLSLQQRAKSLLGALGYRVEGLAHGQLLAHADLGRRYYSVLVHVLPERTKPDFAALLARRREVGSTYAALFGHALDLTSYEAPAELARTSLWSWSALGRLENVLDVLPVGPVDLESHFESDGLFEKGFDRFENSVQQRIQERGTFSAVLTHLAALRAPAIFVLDDVLSAEVNREEALKVLELLSQAPFHLVSKVDSGEFCLRFKVSDALLKLSEYALSLRIHLPSRRTERLQGSKTDPAFETEDEAVAVTFQSKAR